MIPSREQALAILLEYNDDAHLITHAKTVEGVMRHFARKFSQDEELWGVVGLLHDLDYQKYPEAHCEKTLEILREKGVDEIVARACASHGHGICIDLPPESLMEKTLYTIDELSGLLTAAVIMRPSKSVLDFELKSAKKKYKSKGFAAGCDRALIEKGASMLAMELDEVIWETILGMREAASEIGLMGTLPKEG